MTEPLVSVLIPTFNRAHYVGDAVLSALGQTLRDIEVVVVDDGSTDDTVMRLAALDDPRLRIVRHETNRGIPTTRNTALSAAKGRYLAWLDSDDVARPHRLAEQVAFLDGNPAVAMVGSCAGKLRPDGSRKAGIRVPPLSPAMISAWLLFRSAFQQSSIMGRADALGRYSYDPKFSVCEDFDMFQRLQSEYRLANMPRVLIDRRLHPNQSIRQRQDEIQGRTMALIAPVLDRLGVDAGAEDLRRHVLLGKASLQGSDVPPDFLPWARNWLSRLNQSNMRARLIDPPSLAFASDYFWLLACRAVSPRIGRLPALKAMVGRPPRGLCTPTALAWGKAAVPVYLGR
jgi:glycosyltransferase involved in cell wall biosynthesis